MKPLSEELKDLVKKVAELEREVKALRFANAILRKLPKQ